MGGKFKLQSFGTISLSSGITIPEPWTSLLLSQLKTEVVNRSPTGTHSGEWRELRCRRNRDKEDLTPSLSSRMEYVDNPFNLITTLHVSNQGRCFMIILELFICNIEERRVYQTNNSN